MAWSSGVAGSCWGSLPYLLCGRQMHLYTVGHTNTHVSVYSMSVCCIYECVYKGTGRGTTGVEKTHRSGETEHK